MKPGFVEHLRACNALSCFYAGQGRIQARISPDDHARLSRFDPLIPDQLVIFW
jgi:hypothetical protein